MSGFINGKLLDSLLIGIICLVCCNILKFPYPALIAVIVGAFTGIGLFIFLWAITGEFGIGAIGLLVMFMGLGQWLIGYKQHANENTKNRETAIRSNDIIISEKNDEEKNEENR